MSGIDTRETQVSARQSKDSGNVDWVYKGRLKDGVQETGIQAQWGSSVIDEDQSGELQSTEWDLYTEGNQGEGS